MKIIEKKDYNEMSQMACDTLIQCLKEKPDALFCIATGSSPTRAYQLFVQQVKKEHIDTSNMRVIKLDEWCGLSKDNPATCEYYIQEHILTPLNIPREHYISFNPMEKNADFECSRISGLLAKSGGIDCCVLGIGKNGHLGLNEPREAINPFIHKIDLDAKTKAHTMLSQNDVEVFEGYTLGMKDILDSKKILLLVTGDEKQAAYRNLKEKQISSKLPANYLWLHENALCIADSSSLF